MNESQVTFKKRKPKVLVCSAVDMRMFGVRNMISRHNLSSERIKEEEILVSGVSSSCHAYVAIQVLQLNSTIPRFRVMQ